MLPPDPELLPETALVVDAAADMVGSDETIKGTRPRAKKRRKSENGKNDATEMEN